MLVLSLEDNEILNSYSLSGHTVFLFLLPKRFLILKGRDLLKIFNPALNNTKSLSLISSHFKLKISLQITLQEEALLVILLIYECNDMSLEVILLLCYFGIK